MPNRIRKKVAKYYYLVAEIEQQRTGFLATLSWVWLHVNQVTNSHRECRKTVPKNVPQPTAFLHPYRRG